MPRGGARPGAGKKRKRGTHLRKPKKVKKVRSAKQIHGTYKTQKKAEAKRHAKIGRGGAAKYYQDPAVQQQAAAAAWGQQDLFPKRFTTEHTNIRSTRGRRHAMEAPLELQPQTAQTLRMDSTVISAIKHNRKTLLLRVYFLNGHIYDYSGVPVGVVDRWMDDGLTKSKGRFFNHNIRTSYGTPTRIK